MLLRTRRGLIEFGRPRVQTLETIGRLVDQFGESPAGLKYLRGALAEVSPALPEELSPEDILAEAEARIIEGALTFVFLRPHDAPTPGFIVEGDAAVVVTDQKNEAGDLKPAPEIPPIYPIIARAESDQMIDSTAKLVGKLAALLFNTFGRERRQTTVGRSFVLTAAETGARVVAARSKTDVSLEVAKWPGGGLDRPKPEVPVEYRNAAKSTGEMTKVAIDKLAAKLGPHDPSKSGKPAPTLPETYVQVASGTAQGTKSAITSLGASFGSMMHSGPFVRPRAELPKDDG